jgi:hypothetical protein
MSTLSDDTQVMAENEEVEPPCKKPRLQRQTHFVHLKLHTRLIIYDFVDFEDFDNLTGYDFYCENDMSHSYARITVLASILGDLEALQYLAGVSDNIFIPKNDESLFNGELLEKGYFDMECICYLLASNAHWKALKWAISEKYPHKYGTLTGAIMGGADMDMLHWLHSQGCLGDEYAFKSVAERGDWNIMMWLREINCRWDKRTFIAAADKCSLDILRWLKTENCPWDEQVFHAAAKRGDFKILVWLRLKACPWNSDTFTYAVEGGADLATLEWLYYEKCPLASTTFIAAIKRGDMEILEWLRLLRCPMSSLNFTEAIEYNVNIRMLKWMRGVGCLWDQSAFAAAVKRGDLEILQWLREEHCPWGAECFVIALENKYIEVIRWLNQVQCPFDQKSHELFVQEFVRLSTERGYDA